MDGFIIPKAQAGKYHQILLNIFTGIDAVELKDGTFFISKECYDMLPVDFETTKEQVTFNVKTELSKLPTKKLRVSDFKVSEVEAKIIK